MMKKTVLVLIVLSLTFAASAQKGKMNLRLLAKSVINEKAPELVVEEWLSKQPDLKGKFVLIDFWATTRGPCGVDAKIE